ncbi:MAG TPA: winged helix-turn-helix domain-containing protein [Pyrinomonadaceae bacterium]|nr:winged helix-turn-helix domain-containing protein [Pyrinomonadaceae bacterium]
MNTLREFGAFRLDAERLILWHGGEPVPMPPKEIELLSALVDRQNEVVSKDELMSRVWADSFVEESNISRHIYRLRKMFDEYGVSDNLIQTVPRRGYRFTGKVENVEYEQLIIERHSVSKTIVEEVAGSSRIAESLRSAIFASRLNTSFAALTLLIVCTLLGLLAFTSYDRSTANGFQAKAVQVHSSFPKDDEAYRLYLQGEYHFRRRETSNSGIYFKEAVARDPNFARAWAKLAAVYAMGDAMGEAEATVERALSLEPNLAEAHAVRGFIQMFLNWDWAVAERSFDLAIQIDPTSVEALHWRATYYTIRGRLDDAKRDLHRALDLDPTSIRLISDLGQVYYFSRDFQMAEQLYLQTYREGVGVDRLVELYKIQGRIREAFEVELFRKCGEVRPADVSPCQRDLAASFERGGFPGFARDRLKPTLDSLDRNSLAPDLVASFWYNASKDHVEVGDHENALVDLQRSMTAKTRFEPMNFNFPFIAVDPVYDELRSDPRFAELIRRMNL